MSVIPSMPRQPSPEEQLKIAFENVRNLCLQYNSIAQNGGLSIQQSIAVANGLNLMEQNLFGEQTVVGSPPLTPHIESEISESEPPVVELDKDG